MHCARGRSPQQYDSTAAIAWYTSTDVQQYEYVRVPLEKQGYTRTRTLLVHTRTCLFCEEHTQIPWYLIHAPEKTYLPLMKPVGTQLVQYSYSKGGLYTMHAGHLRRF